MSFTDTVSYRRVVMINGILSLSVLVFIIFTYLNVVIIQDYIMSVLNTFMCLVSLFSLWLLRYEKNIPQVALISTIIFIVFIIIFITRNQNSHFGIIWSIFLPYFAIMFNGKKIGLYLSVFYYSIILTLAYQGIGRMLVDRISYPC